MLPCWRVAQCAHQDPASEEAACKSKRSQVASYPTQEKQGLLWVWADAGPTAFIEAYANPPVANPLVDSWPEGLSLALITMPLKAAQGAVGVGKIVIGSEDI